MKKPRMLALLLAACIGLSQAPAAGLTIEAQAASSTSSAKKSREKERSGQRKREVLLLFQRKKGKKHLEDHQEKEILLWPGRRCENRLVHHFGHLLLF